MPAVLLKDYCFAHQPILEPNHFTVALELLYRDAESEAAPPFDNTSATANVMVNAFNHFGLMELTGKRKLFINVAEDLLLSDTITLLPREKVTLELLETIPVNPEILDRIQHLKAMGYEFALDDYVYHEERSPLFPLVDIIKVDILQTGTDNLRQLVKYLRHWPCRLLAEKVESETVFSACKEAGFDLFQGYYFAHPALLSGRRVDPNKLALLNLLAIVNDNDADISDVEARFKANPGLTYSMLRLVNSPAFYTQSKIGSIRQAIKILGMHKLARWLQVMLFAHEEEQQCSPLLELAVHRAGLMELMAEAVSIPHDRAFVAGMLSLADTAIGMPLDEIVVMLNMVDEVQQALLKREGKIGALLKICEKLENGEFEEVAEIAGTLPLPVASLMEMQAQSISWSNHMIQDIFGSPS